MDLFQHLMIPLRQCSRNPHILAVVGFTDSPTPIPWVLLGFVDPCQEAQVLCILFVKRHFSINVIITKVNSGNLTMFCTGGIRPNLWFVILNYFQADHASCQGNTSTCKVSTSQLSETSQVTRGVLTETQAQAADTQSGAPCTAPSRTPRPFWCLQSNSQADKTVGPLRPSPNNPADRGRPTSSMLSWHYCTLTKYVENADGQALPHSLALTYQ